MNRILPIWNEKRGLIFFGPYSEFPALVGSGSDAGFVAPLWDHSITTWTKRGGEGTVESPWGASHDKR